MEEKEEEGGKGRREDGGSDLRDQVLRHAHRIPQKIDESIMILPSFLIIA